MFQAISIITTTGFATTDFALWPVISLLTLFALMFAGGSAGSTTGSIKVVRHLLLGKVLRRELDQTVSPELVMPIRYNGAPVDERTLRAIAAFILLYVGFWAVGASVIAIDSAISNVPLSPLDTLAVAASALGNGGPGFGITGPFGSFAPLGDVSKITMIVLMWLGRLEIIPVFVLATRHYWRSVASLGAPRSARRRSAVAVAGDDREHLVARPDHRRRLHELGPPLAEDGDEARAAREPEPACLLPRCGRASLDLHLDDHEALLLQLEEPDEAVLGDLVLDETEDARRRSTGSA